MCENGQVAFVKYSPIWKNMRKDFKTFPELKSQSSFSNRGMETGSQVYQGQKKKLSLKHMKEERDFVTYTPTLFKS